jgi:uncharacterized protein YcnI
MRRLLVVIAGALLLFPALASAHAELSPAVSLKGKLQLYSLAVPTEKNNATTTKIVLSVPTGFSIDSFVPSPGWHRVLARGGAVVSWTGGHVPTGEDSLFQFLAQPGSTGTYRFAVRQTYADGSIVNWAGAESSDSPAPTIEVRSSLGGGGSSVLAIVALIVGILGLLVGGFALAGASGRPLA